MIGNVPEELDELELEEELELVEVFILQTGFPIWHEPTKGSLQQDGDPVGNIHRG